MRNLYSKKIFVRQPQDLRGLIPGQWIDYEGATGRYMGRTKMTVWIAWGRTATHDFKTFADAFKRTETLYYRKPTPEREAA
jgi:hypothetical protein